MKNRYYFLKLAFVVVGVAMTAFSLHLYNKMTTFVEEAKKAPGRVVDLEYDTTGGGKSRSGVYVPLIRFEDADGKPHEFHSSNGTNPSTYSVGDSVEVLYDPRYPERARINSFKTLWFGPLLLGGLSLVFIALGGGLLVVDLLSSYRSRGRGSGE